MQSSGTILVVDGESVRVPNMYPCTVAYQSKEQHQPELAPRKAVIGHHMTQLNARAQSLHRPTAPGHPPSNQTDVGSRTTEYPTHPLVVDITSKGELFDQLSSRFEVPSLPVVSA
jgi:hypothetical protein